MVGLTKESYCPTEERDRQGSNKEIQVWWMLRMKINNFIICCSKLKRKLSVCYFIKTKTKIKIKIICGTQNSTCAPWSPLHCPATMQLDSPWVRHDYHLPPPYPSTSAPNYIMPAHPPDFSIWDPPGSRVTLYKWGVCLLKF